MRRYLRPRKWFGWTIDFIIAWTASIPWISFMKGIPAIVLLSVLLVAFAMAYSDGESSWRNALLNDQFKSAWEAEDYKTAGIVLNRQLKGKKDDPDLLFRLAIVKENLGEDAEAMQIMQNLATSDRNVGAARWMLNNFYKGLKWNEMPSDQKAEVGRLLEVIVKADENDLQSKSFLVDFYLASGKEKMATALLDELARREPLMNVRAAYVSKDLKTDFRVERYAKDGVESIGKLLKDEPHKIEYALGLAQCYALLNRYSDAVRTLKKSSDLSGDPKEKAALNFAIGDLFVAWIAYLDAGPQKADSDLKQLQMLQFAMQTSPNHPGINSLVVDKVLASIENKNEEVVTLRKALVKGTSPGFAHFIQGTVDLMNDKEEQGVAHLQLAAEMLPNSGMILNNLAYGLSQKSDADLEQVLIISNSAISNSQRAIPSYFETRGEILFKLGRYTEAIADLEKAIVDPALEKKCHQLLAICYDHVGDKEIADMHRKEANGS